MKNIIKKIKHEYNLKSFTIENAHSQPLRQHKTKK